jgi:hypothetical protein
MSAHGCKLEIMGAVLFARIAKHRGVVGGACSPLGWAISYAFALMKVFLF